MDDNDKFLLNELLKTYEIAYRQGFLDGIQFILDISKDNKILKVFKDGGILK